MERKKLFVSYAIEEKKVLNAFLTESKKENVNYDLVYMAEKDPLSDEWRNNLRQTINDCDGAVFLLTPYLKISEGAFWEMKYSRELSKPMICVFVGDGTIRDKPVDLTGVTTMVMSWTRLNEFVDKC